MRALLATIALVVSLPLHAEPAVFDDPVLHLDEVLVQRADGPLLYTDVELVRRADGSFIVAGGDTVPLAHVDSLSVEADQYPPGTVVVEVQGYKSMPCVDVGPAVVSRVGDTFHFALPELPPPDNVRCITRIEPIAEVFGLQTTGLEPGVYHIVYGELRVSFTLHAAR